ncbi:glycerate kinase, partial [Cellulomonas endophytica]|uniref:glycerate kinase n=1 Tax=Cellulomonas endophytica TaxID=2494735 RepID=UPI00196B24F4
GGRPLLPLGAGDAPTRARGASALGSGAGGGAAWALTAVGARLRPGVEVLAALLDLDARVAAADVVVLVTGPVGHAALSGTVLSALGERCVPLAVPLVVLAPGVDAGSRELAVAGVAAAYPGASGAAATEALAARVARTWSPRPAPAAPTVHVPPSGAAAPGGATRTARGPVPVPDAGA